MSTTNPLVTIVTPMHQGAAYIRACLESVAAQNFGDYEHLVVDNFSTDAGPEIVRDFASQDGRVRLLDNLASRGAGPTRNVAIAAAQGRYIAFLDCDDAWAPRKLERQIGMMRADGAALSWTGYNVVDEQGNFIRQIRPRVVASRRDILTKRAHIGCLTAVYDRQELGRIYMNSIPMRQDFCLWLDVAAAAESRGLSCVGLDESLASYRVHRASLSANKRKAALFQWRALRSHAGLSVAGATLCFGSYAIRTVSDRLFSGEKAAASR